MTRSWDECTRRIQVANRLHNLGLFFAGSAISSAGVMLVFLWLEIPAIAFAIISALSAIAYGGLASQAMKMSREALMDMERMLFPTED